MKSIDFFALRYRDASIQLSKKSRILAGCALSFGIISLAFAAFMAATKAPVVALIFGLIVTFCAVVLALLRAGRYHLASSLFLYGLFAAMFAAIKFDAYVNVYETYVFGTLGCFLLVVTTLVADRPSQAGAISVLSILGIQALYWLDSFPVEGTVSLLAMQNLAVPTILTATAGFAAARVVSMTKGLLAEVEDRAAAAASSFTSLDEAMNAAQSSSKTVGERLASGVSHGLASVAQLREKVAEIAAGMDRLALALGHSSEANAEAVAKQDEVKSALASYSDEVSRVSAAMEEMAAAAHTIGAQASEKKEAVAGLVSLADSGEGLLESMSASIGAILEGSKKMAELNVFIADIAERTNLLGMNASIEAAHAGSVGKGFAVVATQIRALSIEAGKSTRVIRETLGESQAAVETAERKNADALAFFRRISTEIREVSELLEELLANVAELSSGSAEVLSAVGRVAALTDRTESTVLDARSSIGVSTDGLAEVSAIANVVHAESGAMVGHFDRLRDDMAVIDGLGRENLETIERLKQSLVKIESREA